MQGTELSEETRGAPGGLKMAVFFVHRQRSTKLMPASPVWAGTTKLKLPIMRV